MLRILATVFLLGIPLFIFGLYTANILYYVKRRKGKHPVENTRFEPFVSVVIPTHNEESMISRKIENLLASGYPDEKTEIIFVDDSNDSTPQIIGEYMKKHQNIRLIRFPERRGYSPCMIAGCKAANGEILIFGDAGSFIEPETISNLVRHFQKPDIGAVTGSSRILNVNEGVGKSEQLYVKMMNFIREGETIMDSTFHFNGEACAVRKKLISDIDRCDASFDTTAALLARQKGYRTIYDPSVRFHEYAPQTRSERIKQKTIRAANLIKVLFRFRHMMFKREYGKFGFVVLPMNFAMYVIVPLAILMGFTLLFPLTLLDLRFSAILWTIVGFVFLLLLVFGRHLMPMFLEFEYSLLKALYQVAFTRRTHDKIEKVNSTRRC